MLNTLDSILEAAAALRAAGYIIEAVPGIPDVYRLNEGGVLTGVELLAMATRLSLMDETGRAQ